ncbi:MAG: sterol desaturase family protein [Alsobacter sp.]
MSALGAILVGMGQSILNFLPILGLAAVLFTLVSLVATPCNPGPRWWRKPDLALDLCYWFLGPVVASWISVLLLTGFVYMIFHGEVESASVFLRDGHGLLAPLPFWLQIPTYLLLIDFILYWTHRLFHSAKFWRYHAIHHSSEHLDWTSATRFHPGNLLLGNTFADLCALFLGIAPEVLVAVAPFNVLTGAMVHANLDWTFGPFRYVFASPIFHRWHHTTSDRGGNKNFAPTFPFLDLAFGTFYMPDGQRPDRFGTDDRDVPRNLIGQLAYPWLGRRNSQNRPVEGAPH